MKTNSLRIEPHRVMPDMNQDFYRDKNRIVLWRVWIDDHLESENAAPFDKDDSGIDMSIDPNYELWGDSNFYICVRFVGNYIIWAELEMDGSPCKSWRSSKTMFFVFDRAKYAEICDAANSQTERKNMINVCGRMPKLSQAIQSYEIKMLLQEFFPEDADENAIYRLPDDRYDTTGLMICRRIQKAIAESTTFKICDEPAKTIDLQIGLDMPEFIEAVWHIGRCEEGFAIYFEEYPYFPAWLYSENLSKVIAQEEFSKEL